jgi:peptide deformylase
LTEYELSHSVVKIDDVEENFEIPLGSLVESILDIMYNNGGIGLTAAHTRLINHKKNIQKRIVVIDIKAQRNQNGEIIKRGKKPIVMINPEIIEHSWEKFVLNGGEGSLSIPGRKKFLLERFKNIKVKYYNLDGILEDIEVNYNDNKLLNVCIQHEIDQVNGVLVSDAGIQCPYTENV